MQERRGLYNQFKDIMIKNRSGHCPHITNPDLENLRVMNWIVKIIRKKRSCLSKSVLRRRLFLNN
jgi:hypothetical protein